MTSIVPCCIANANGSLCSCHIPDASITFEQLKQVRNVVSKWTMILKEGPSDNMSYHTPTISAILRDLRNCGSADELPNATANREPEHD